MRSCLIMATALLAAAPLLTACKEDGPPPPPVELTGNETGYFCHMIVADHPGPKAQIHLANRAQPLFFPSVVDAVAFLMMPGETKAIRAVYVNDMAKARDWQAPGPGTWIDASTAYFVIDSRKVSGMGHKEAVPFGSKESADAFRGANGGSIARLSEIPESYVFPGANAADASAAPSGRALADNPKEAVP